MAWFCHPPGSPINILSVGYTSYYIVTLFHLYAESDLRVLVSVASSLPHNYSSLPSPSILRCSGKPSLWLNGSMHTNI